MTLNLPAVFGALADPTRLALVRLLVSGPMTATDLLTELGISQPRASRHLRILREAGVVRATRRGRWVFFALSSDPQVGHLAAVISGMAARVPAAAPPPAATPAGEHSATPHGRAAPPEIEEFLL